MMPLTRTILGFALAALGPAHCLADQLRPDMITYQAREQSDDVGVLCAISMKAWVRNAPEVIDYEIQAIRNHQRTQFVSRYALKVVSMTWPNGMPKIGDVSPISEAFAYSPAWNTQGRMQQTATADGEAKGISADFNISQELAKMMAVPPFTVSFVRANSQQRRDYLITEAIPPAEFQKHINCLRKNFL